MYESGWAANTANVEARQCLIDMSGCLDLLPKAREHDDGSYDRDLFGSGWAQRDGCSVRYWVLIDEAVETPQTDGCDLAGGEWFSLFDGETGAGGGSGFDIDHLVPLREAWGSGAHRWSDGERRRYHNDTSYEHHLIAVSDSSNRSKGAQDPAEWMPYDGVGALTADQRHVRCGDVTAWVTVKFVWELAGDPQEEAALRSEIGECAAPAAS